MEGMTVFLNGGNSILRTYYTHAQGLTLVKEAWVSKLSTFKKCLHCFRSTEYLKLSSTESKH